MRHDDYLEERLRRSDPAPSDTQLPESMWDEATFLDALDERDAGMPAAGRGGAGWGTRRSRGGTRQRWRGPMVAAGAAAVALVIAAATVVFLRPAPLDPFATAPPTAAPEPTVTTLATTVPVSEGPLSSCMRGPGEEEFEEIFDGAIAKYGPGRYRVDQLDPMVYFTIADSWRISDLDFDEPDDVGFSGMEPGGFSDDEWPGTFVEFWPVTSWCDVVQDTNVVFEPGELAAAIASDTRLTGVAVAEATVGSCSATRIDAQVKLDYLEGTFFLGRTGPRNLGDIPGCASGNAISHEGNASERVTFWAVNVDGTDLMISATYPNALAEGFESMVNDIVESIEFEAAP